VRPVIPDLVILGNLRESRELAHLYVHAYTGRKGYAAEVRLVGRLIRMIAPGTDKVGL
jgi:hypothetical protein